MSSAPNTAVYNEDSDTLEGLVANVTQLVSLPDVFLRFEKELNNPTASSESLADILVADPDITSRLLSLANSAFFGFSTRVETVHRALVLIGTSQVRDLILATVVVERFSKLPIGILDMAQFWRHSIATASLARALGVELRIRAADKLFIGGLLHDIGRLVLVLERADDMAEALLRVQDADVALDAVEREIFGFDHGQVGEALAKAWSLPESVSDMIAGHHSPNTLLKPDVDLVHLADVMAHAFGWGRSGQRLIPPICLESWERTGLDIDAIDEVQASGMEIYNDMQSMILSG